jgi:hypothetical protein
MQPEDIFRMVLALLWVWAVHPVIRSLNLEVNSYLSRNFFHLELTTFLQKSDVPPRLWWCPTGPFAFLPIHAAGIYDEEITECVSDYVVSSYTPTITALLGDMPLPTDPFKMVAVIQRDTPGQISLPSAADELQKIEDHVPNQELVRLAPGYVKEVISHLSTTSIAHFACHGQQNVHNPLESALLLQDGQLKVSQIMQQSMPNASLAFLSACETAMGDENLPDDGCYWTRYYPSCMSTPSCCRQVAFRKYFLCALTSIYLLGEVICGQTARS